MMTGGSWRWGFPGWGPKGRDWTSAPSWVSSETRNPDIYWVRVRGGLTLDGMYRADLDDILAAVVVCGDGGYGDGFSETFMGCK